MQQKTCQQNPRVGGLTLSFIQIALGMVLLILFPNGRESVILAAPAPASQASKWSAQLPEGPAKSIVVDKCQYCHTLERVVAARLPKDGWLESVNRMIDLGTPMNADEVPILVEYLTANFGPAAPKSPTATFGDKAKTDPSAANLSDSLYVDPDQATFASLPDSMGSMKNVEMSVISGDPLKPAPFSILLKISSGGSLPASWHSGTDIAVVCLRGSVQFAEDGNSDPSKLITLKPGALLHIRGQNHSFAGHAKDGAIILVYGAGPLSMLSK